MKKSVYSLVLSDSLINKIDHISYLSGKSRSNLVNEILAEYLSYSTPEKKITDIFENLENLISEFDAFKMINQPSTNMFSVKSALKYKYNPTVKYSVELFKEIEDFIGKLKVNFRTQSIDFIDYLRDFFIFWSYLEDKYISNIPDICISRSAENGRFIRFLHLPLDEKHRTNEYIGKAIGEYINIFDSVLNLYFSNINNLYAAKTEAEKLYKNYVRNGIII
ncbi:MAG: hypothetical protein IJQ50_04630 [Clostridia bacterium]|nr:hypothetical protein [Clostridia bacterium]